MVLRNNADASALTYLSEYNLMVDVKTKSRGWDIFRGFTWGITWCALCSYLGLRAPATVFHLIILGIASVFGLIGLIANYHGSAVARVDEIKIR